MRALVVYESAFGNTEQIARAIADGLSTCRPTHIFEVGHAPLDLADEVDLLVVGGPTQAFGMSRTGTRAEAAKKAEGAAVSAGRGLREWLEAVRGIRPGLPAAVFDTRFAKPRWLTGSAARAARKRLLALGCRVPAPVESFFVSGTSGPLVEGELDRARRWGERVGSLVVEGASRS